MTTTTQPTWRVRIDDPAGLPRGAGVLVTERYVLTCAHVVADAREALNTQPLVTATEVPAASPVEATVVKGGWFPPDDLGRGDIAVLALAEQPLGAAPAVLRPAGPAGGREVRAYGYPRGGRDGVWVSWRLMGAAGPGWMQLDAQFRSSFSYASFSGAGVVDAASGAVIGILVAGNPVAESAFVIPLETVARYWPPMRDLLAGPADAAQSPRRDQPQRIAELVDALLAIPSVADAASRREVIHLLPRGMPSMIERHGTSRLDVYAIVRTCLDHPDGLATLLDIIRTFEGNTPQRPGRRGAGGAAADPRLNTARRTSATSSAPRTVEAAAGPRRYRPAVPHSGSIM